MQVWKGPQFNADGVIITRRASFEQAAIGTMHRIWYPQCPYNNVKKACDDICVLWRWYREHACFTGRVPDITFVLSNTQWSRNAHDIVKTPIAKWDIFKEWDAQPTEAVVFPLIGMQGVIHKVDTVPQRDGIVKCGVDGQLYFMESLRQYASTFEPCDFILE